MTGRVYTDYTLLFCWHEVDFAELDSFDTQDVFGKFVNPADMPFQDDNLHTIVLIKVHMGGTNGLQKVCMLKVGHFFHKFCCVMVVNHTDGGDGLCPGILQLPLADTLTYKVGNGLRAIVVTVFFYYPVKRGKQVLFE